MLPRARVASDVSSLADVTPLLMFSCCPVENTDWCLELSSPERHVNSITAVQLVYCRGQRAWLGSYEPEDEQNSAEMLRMLQMARRFAAGKAWGETGGDIYWAGTKLGQQG